MSLDPTLPQLQRLSLSFHAPEDRILLTGSDQHGKEHAYLITRRLLIRLLPKLLEWLANQGQAPAHLNEGQRDELNRMRHWQSVRQQEQQAAATPAPASAVAPTPAASAPPSAPLLVRQVAFTYLKQSLLVSLIEEKDGPVCAMVKLQATQAHWLVNRLRRFGEVAQWDIPSTSIGWLHDELDTQGAPASIILH